MQNSDGSYFISLRLIKSTNDVSVQLLSMTSQQFKIALLHLRARRPMTVRFPHIIRLRLSKINRFDEGANEVLTRRSSTC